jgi:hypothetical protein
MFENHVLVAGKIPFHPWEYIRTDAEKTEKVLNELVLYLLCFLEGHVYSENSEQARSVIEEMLEKSKITENTIELSFPENIISQFRFPHSFEVPLQYNAGFTFYKEELLPKVKLTCTITIDEENENVKNTILHELQTIILETHYRIKHIRLRKIGKKYEVIIGFNQKIKRIKRTTSTISDALMCVRESLL